MEYTERLQNVAVLGAAGKMGSGILLLTAMEMADLSLKPENKGKPFVLHAIDVSHDVLSGLMDYIRAQVVKAAERKAVGLRATYADRNELIENYDIIGQYVIDVMNVIRPTTKFEAANEAKIIFEAIKEDPELKIQVLGQIDKNNPHKPWYFTNTSSIPITQLDEKAELEGRIVGFHFYNPPAVQKLVELIKSKHTTQEVVDFSMQYAKKLRKVIVPSNDYAGFIGNGHFMRDALHGITEVEKLTKEMPFVEAVYCINKVSQDYLIRPMGIFQLIDYVGIDVVQYIMGVMNPHLPDENLHSPLLERMLELGVKGGQYANGSQKDGFLKYEKGRVAGIYDPDKKTYVQVADIQAKCDAWLGTMPSAYKPWKAVIGAKDKDGFFKQYFTELKGMSANGTELAKRYAIRSKEIGQQLVDEKVAFNPNDVNTVLLTGFFHAYGPINDFLN